MPRPIRVLLLEDQPTDARLIISELRRSDFDPAWERVDTEQEFVGRLESEWDLILADYSLPQFDALRALQHVHRSGRDIPFIIVSGNIGEETAVAAMKEGATDYLLKDRLGRLGPAVTHALEQRQLRDTRRKTEENLRQSEMKFREIFKQLQLQIERMPLAYILFDRECRVIDWNPAAEKTFGYAKEEILGLAPPFEKIVPPEARPALNEILHRLKSGDMTAHSVNENLTKDGRIITCEWINTPLQSGDHQFSGLMCLVHDVTERKQLEEQFRQAQKMEAVGKLAGGVAHDFNNLLTIILGYSDILLESLPETDPLRELVDQIYKSGTRAAGLTHQLLAFSRKQVLVPVILDLNTLLSDTGKMLGRLIGEDVKLAFHPAENLWRVRVDPGQMEQVVMNLVVNSRDAMPQGGKLTIATANVDLSEMDVAIQPDARPGEYVLMTVSDTGCGIDRATQARIFEPFFSTKGEKGTGLGLATVYGIVKQSGGHIEVHSELNRGTTFKIYLPRDLTDVDTSSAQVVADAAGAGTQTVLLVEDEESVRSFARAALQRVGYTVLEAHNGSEALVICEQYAETIHLLATDVVMPNMSGRELAERVLLLRPATKVLYMSGYMDDAIIRHGLVQGRVPFLQKPFTLAALDEKVREALACMAE